MTKKTWFELESHTGEVLCRLNPDLSVHPIRANRRRLFAKRSDGYSVVGFKTEKSAKLCAAKLFASGRADLPKFIVVVRFEPTVNRTTPCMFRNPKAPPAKKRAA